MTNKDALIESIISLVRKSEGFKKEASKEEVGTLTLDQKEAYFNKLWNSPKGLQKVAYAMTGPFKIMLDYNGIGRKLLKVDPIPQGEFPIYDKDIPEFASVVAASHAAPPMIDATSKRVEIPTFKLAVNGKVDFEEIVVRRYNFFDREKTRVAISLAIAEDRQIFGLLSKAAAVGPNAGVSGALGRATVADAMAIIAGNQLQPATLVMNPTRFAQLQKLGSSDIDPVTLNTIVNTGSIGSFMGLNVLASTKLVGNDVYLTTTPDKLGIIPVRKEAEIGIFNNQPHFCYNVCGWEVIGFGILNTYGIVKIS